ncbi:MAG: dynamin family protein [Anaerolineae bacterium]|nr:dynamin family protein [Anaerolineae bacterium]
MAEALPETRLIQEYESIRHRQYELITGLLDVLPRIDKVGEQRLNQVRDALFHADHPFLMVFVGPFNSGKSSLINALLGTPDLLKSGPTPTTDRVSILRYGDAPQVMNSGGEVDTVFHPSPLLKRVSFVDTPGLESTVQAHEEITRKFLHRADCVLLVMLATRAMTQSNLQYFQTFKEYGKKVIVVINQVDLLTEEERATVRDYVYQQSKDKLGVTPEIWLVSARQGLAAVTPEGGREVEGWQASGLAQVEAYIEKSLGDADRLRQKLQTPLQILQNVHQAALVAVRENQSAFDSYRAITDNVNRQLEAQKRDQEARVKDTLKEVDYRFSSVAERSATALHEIFQLSRALSSLGRGLLEMIGLMRFFQRPGTPLPTHATFLRRQVFEPVTELNGVVEKLPPRLEGQDMQDIDDLVKYGQREMNALPASMRDKIIGTIQAPAKYDRSMFQDIRADLERLEAQARVVEVDRLEDARRNTLIVLAAWQLVLVICLVALFNAWGALGDGGNSPFPIIALILLLSGVMLGFILLPLRGRIMANGYAARLAKVKADYIDLLTRAADRQIEYSMKLRRDAIAPLTRLVEAQVAIQDEQLNKLKTSETAITRIETDLNAFGKRKFLGMSM